MTNKKAHNKSQVSNLVYNTKKKKWQGEGTKGRSWKDPVTITEALERGHKTFGLRVDVKNSDTADSLTKLLLDYVYGAMKTVEKLMRKKGHRVRVFFTVVDLDDNDSTNATLEKVTAQLKTKEGNHATEEEDKSPE